ncbi:hypothetical protein SCHPADRAFT_559678 [Schizopora paradoxa]|uniref:Uncharacterized protein n=1 Tax=Schizopora paradoxa TaxID=27342 RepID=A0A0H2RCP0_9AGAM|nr:hypothetical protein SCHPADRAFT_559678 [Schizopora paradoxa]
MEKYQLKRFKSFIKCMNRLNPNLYPLPLLKGSFIGGLRQARRGDIIPDYSFHEVAVDHSTVVLPASVTGHGHL